MFYTEKTVIIITDHHECPEVLPNALAVIDAKRPDSTYPFNSLAGVGVTFKLIHAISIKLNLDRKSYLQYLDIVCLGTVADIVPLLDENRLIVNFGLKLVSRIENHIPALQSDITLYDAKTGELLAIMDGNWITAMRTGAVAALAARTFQKQGTNTYSM